MADILPKRQCNELPSDFVLKDMFRLSEAVGILRGVMLNNSYVEQFQKIILLNEMYYLNILCGNDYTHKELLYLLSKNDNKNEVYNQSVVIQSCYKFAIDKANEYDIFLPADFLRINEAIKNSDIYFLEDTIFIETYDQQIKLLSDIFIILYEYDDNYSIFFNVAKACLMFYQKEAELQIETSALNILFTVLINRDKKMPDITVSITKLYILHQTRLHKTDSIDCDMQISLILNYFSDEFEDMAIMVKRLSVVLDDIKKALLEKIPKIYSQGLFDIVSTHYSFRYSDLTARLNVTYKTAVEYAKLLEKHGFITSEKNGREKIFLNKRLFSLSEDVDTNGSKK